MAQNFTQIQQAFDTALTTVISANQTPGGGITSVTLYSENKVMNFAMQPDITTKLGVRTTLIPTKTIVETLGPTGYVSVNGMYAIDVIGQINTGYTGVQLLADIILAAFPRATIMTLGNGDTINIATSSPSTNTNQGAWAMNKLYCRQVMVEFFGYVQP